MSKRGPRANRTSAKPGFIYLIKNAKTGLYKIGISTNLKKRLYSLRYEHSAKIELIHSRYIDGAGGLERRLHCKFVELHQFGEWFSLGSNEINEAISDIDSWSWKRPQEARGS